MSIEQPTGTEQLHTSTAHKIINFIVFRSVLVVVLVHQYRCHAVLGRTHMCLLAYWRTGLLVLVQGSWYYVYVSYATNAGTNGPQPAAATTKKLRPGRGRPRHKKRAAAGRNCGRPRLCGRLRPTGPDVMHWCTVHTSKESTGV